MGAVTVDTERTNWGITHLVTGPAGAVKHWCKNFERSCGFRVLTRELSKNDDGTATWRMDVDSNYQHSSNTHDCESSSGPGFWTFLAASVGLGWLFFG